MASLAAFRVFVLKKDFVSFHFDYWPLSCCFFKEIVKDSWEACDGG